MSNMIPHRNPQLFLFSSYAVHIFVVRRQARSSSTLVSNKNSFSFPGKLFWSVLICRYLVLLLYMLWLFRCFVCLLFFCAINGKCLLFGLTSIHPQTHTHTSWPVAPYLAACPLEVKSSVTTVSTKAPSWHLVLTSSQDFQLWNPFIRLVSR